MTRIIIEFSDGRSLDNLVIRTDDRPEIEVLADVDRAMRLMAERGFRPTGTRTFQTWGLFGWRRMAESELHQRGPRYEGGFRTSAVHLR